MMLESGVFSGASKFEDWLGRFLSAIRTASDTL